MVRFPPLANAMKTSDNPRFEQLRRWLMLAIALFAVLGIAFLVVAVWMNRFDPVLTDLAMANFPAIIGLPLAAVTAFIVVAVFRQSENPIEFEALGFKLKGAAGEIVLWIACFIAIVVGMRVLWKY
jgi:hypothetical protein